MTVIAVRGAEEHNLKNIDVDIPKNAIVAVTGRSGSGKSSLVFDTVYAEAFRRFAGANQTPVFMAGRSLWAKLGRPRFRSLTGLPPALGLSQRQGVAGKTSTVGTLSGISDLLRIYYVAFGEIFCRKCDVSLKALSFDELGERVKTDFAGEKIFIISPVVEKRKGAFADDIRKFRELGFAKLRVNGQTFDLQDDGVTIEIDFRKLNTIDVIIDCVLVSPEKTQRIERGLAQALEHGRGLVKIETGKGAVFKFNTRSTCPQCNESAPQLDPRHLSHSSLGQCPTCQGTGSSLPDLPEDLFPCPTCHGARLHPDGPVVRVCGHTYEKTQSLTVNALLEFTATALKKHAANDKARLRVFLELEKRAQSLVALDIGHLVLNRSGCGLAPGDLQRLRLGSLMTNRLFGALYAIDEPCQGLTQHEVKHLVGVLRQLVRQGASVLAVEHHPAFLAACDHLICLGPGAGRHGGQVVSTEQFTAGPGHTVAHAPKNRKTNSANNVKLLFHNLNLRGIRKKEVALWQKQINLIRGPSGAGKSSFLELCLLPTLSTLCTRKEHKEEDSTQSDKVLISSLKSFCQSETAGEILVHSVNRVKPGSLQRSSRRSVASALDILVPIRQLFARLPASLVMGLSEKHFSWHSKLGQCTTCEGRGYIEFSQRYSTPMRIECEMCLGSKLTSRSLLPRFKGYNLDEILQLTLEQAMDVFAHHPLIVNRLEKADQFGLGYIQLGQGLESLSGGELQRLNLTMELRKSNLEGAWFLLVHPSTGLHHPDIDVLGKLMRLMAERGATFVLLENREEFLPYAQNIIDFS